MLVDEGVEEGQIVFIDVEEIDVVCGSADAPVLCLRRYKVAERVVGEEDCPSNGNDSEQIDRVQGTVLSRSHFSHAPKHSLVVCQCPPPTTCPI